MNWLTMAAFALRLLGFVRWAEALWAAHDEGQRLKEQANAAPLTDQEEADRLLE